MNCANAPWYAVIIAQVLYMGLEFWLGKTDKTKSGSVPELIFNLIKLFTKGKDDGTTMGR